ncbi:hypothetical protein DXG03_009316 [Asterophora parasitica]|uniref:Uncharacterized protein n=1 Tax=Asterophora parasitica TaxID=117018 RepID=A0A9P7KCK3_9AGAR|nr:hypothetical protein DXG03_009316 [Asterophora parasitica]
MPDETSPLVRPQEEANNSSDVEDDTAIVNEQPEETKIEVSGKSYLAFVIPMSIGIFLSAMDGTIIVSCEFFM